MIEITELIDAGVEVVEVFAAAQEVVEVIDTTQDVVEISGPQGPPGPGTNEAFDLDLTAIYVVAKLL